ncbi:amino acid adenylation domain-containing protein [Chitinophaga niastensis]|uniref:Amino acid adenylation domain-containing protein n=1 Tax=Chitinophaga niastensis TaxID=536980 RepID=A0A2P8HPB5_CHINA|nr:non-ribosomal peptide synthetase [Chitinophaga niastensis]PSL48037.1 amino acid adenylation domain-containing protein [Chitinophaga niastensis]
MCGNPLRTEKSPLYSSSSNGGPSDSEIKNTPVAIKADGCFINQLLGFSKELNTTLDYVLLTAFQILLYRYGNQKESHIASLMDDKLIPVYDELSGEQTFTESLHRLIAIVKAAKEQNEKSYEDYTAVLSGVFVIKPASAALTIDAFKQVALNYDIGLVLYTSDAGMEGQLLYSAKLFNEAAGLKIATHYKQLLVAILNQPNQKIGTLSMLTDDELRELAMFNDTTAPYPMDKTLHTLLEEQVVKTPDNIALQLGNKSITYKELNDRANQLARLLVEHGIRPGDNVGLLVARSFDMITAMYAIFKAGGAYIPVDPDYPIDRQQYILSNSAVSLLITDQEYPLNSLMPDAEAINISTAELSKYDTSNLNIYIDSRQLAYTIYTSGSTGKPKGVMIEHHSAVNLILWVNNRFGVGADDRLLFITSMCFDLSVYDIFGILATGGSVVIATQAEVSDINQLQLMLQRYRITFWDSVPSTLDYLVKELTLTNNDYKQHFLRLVFLSGDWIPVSLPDKIKHFFPVANVISLGGATEATVWSNYFVVEKTEANWRSIPYGKPITNNFFYILNDQLQPVPTGVTGELFIGGVGVARGYAGDPEKTAASFLTDPFNAAHGAKMYRTGDLGRMLPGMNMEFIGRKDNQVKIRGFRVELGEIENILYQGGQLESAVVLAKEDKDGKKDLIGYVVPKGTFDKHVIIDYLKAKLPDYMVPIIWVEMQSLPLNINGKIDRKALLNIEIPRQTAPLYTASLTQDEKIMTAIWQEVFGIEKIGTNDNFFELGGHSLMALQIMSRFENKTGIKLPAAILFKNPTIASLLTSIEKENATTNWQSLIPIKPTGNKMPLYIIHGDGLYTFNFKELAKYVDDEQPLFGLQPWDLKEVSKATETMVDIAGHYVGEILEHNPNGPYAIAGYSFGGYVAVEMERQLTALGKEVKMLGIFDTDAENAIFNKSWHVKLPKKIMRQFPKFLWIIKSSIKDPSTTLNYQYNLFLKKMNGLGHRLGILKEPSVEGIYSQIRLINQKHHTAFKAYNIMPFNNFVYLFKAKSRINFVGDAKCLGWRKYAQKGVKVFDVPGDHVTMLQQPNVCEFGKKLQDALNNC